MSNKTVEPHKSSIGGLDANVTALLVYIVTAVISFVPGLAYFCWIVPLVAYFIETQSDFIRFHAMQTFVILAINALIAFLFNVVIRGIIVAAVYNPYSALGALGAFSVLGIIVTAVNIIIFVFAVIAAVQAYKYVEYSIPLIAPIVRKVSAIFVKK
jgi:uncharacterized membrane protein